MQLWGHKKVEEKRGKLGIGGGCGVFDGKGLVCKNDLKFGSSGLLLGLFFYAMDFLAWYFRGFSDLAMVLQRRFQGIKLVREYC